MLIGQMKGYYPTLDPMKQNPSENAAWNVEALIQAALAMPEADRLRKHFTPASAMQRIANPTGPVAGTFFDPDVAVANAEGNYGDVIGVDLKQLAARWLLYKEGKLTYQDQTMPFDKLDAGKKLNILLRSQKITEFAIDAATIALFTRDNNLNLDPRMRLVLETGAKTPTPYSRLSTDSANPSDAAGRTEADFRTSGILFFVPTIDEEEVKELRAGKTLGPRDGQFSFKFKDGKEWKDGFATVTAKDYATSSNANTVFFGDRPLDNPGYSEFGLKGEVKIGSDDPLDVYRVEQRLRYLGFPQFRNNGHAGNPRSPSEFKVDGQFGNEEELALQAFYAITHLGRGIARGIDDTTKLGAAKTVTPGSDTLAWLNAFNAPHWMNAYDSFGIPYPPAFQETLHFKDNTSDTFEIYATSWLRDLLKAWEVSKSTLTTAGLPTTKFQLNGLTDPAYRFTEHNNGNHSIGMGLDLGVKQWIDPDNQKKQDVDGTGNNPTVNVAGVAGSGWSVQRSVDLSALLPDGLAHQRPNNQRQALRDFLALYALTREDSVPGNGTWEELLRGQQADIRRKALFGDGTREGGLIARVLIGGQTYTNRQGQTVTQNPYDDINAILDELDIEANPRKNHHNHFHAALRAPSRQEIVARHQLAAPAAGGETGADDALLSAARALLDEMLSPLDEEGGLDMLILDLPAAPPPQTTPVMVAQAAQAKARPYPTVGVCELIDNRKRTEGGSEYGEGGFSVARAAQTYLERVTGRAVVLEATETYVPTGKELIVLNKRESGELYRTVQMVEAPMHGTVKMGANENEPNRYIPEPGYYGTDRASFLIEVAGHKIKVIVFFKMLSHGIGGTEGYDPYWDRKNCPHGPEWIISIPRSSAPALEIGPLDGYAVAQATGASITLSPTAAGHGWYIDSTPDLNEEFLPTSHPNEWVAKPGGEAEGKMDLLTVLLHEYGHALGLEHSADAHDYMAATLQPGVRRTLSVDQQLALMRLTGYFPVPESPSQPYGPTDPGAPLPGTRAGGTTLARRRVVDYLGKGEAFDDPVPQYDTAAHPKLANPEFTDGQGWSTTGAVTFENGAATLSETATTQTRLNQVFVLGEHDRFLSFTVANATLGDQAGGPSDAFEVALIDANTGAALLGGTGLTHNDAFLNRQADGREHTAGGISTIANPDGSRTYLVDLAGVAPGTAVNLAFDLIGFGRGLEARNSRLTIRDLRLGVPQTADDAAATAEDTPLAIDALANDLNARQPGFAPVIVEAPAHGSVVINPDGSFRYSPEQDWYGEDRFTYQLSDGHVDSNLATVVLTVAPVNDAPTIAECSVALDEDGRITVDLLQGAADVDGDALTFPLLCPKCGGDMRIIAFITEAAVVRDILAHLGEPTAPPRMAPARGPPLWEVPVAGQDGFDPQSQPAPDYEFDQSIAW